MLTDQQSLTSGLAAPALVSIRSLYMSAFPDVLRVAVLAEIAGSAAALARRAALLGHVDMGGVFTLVTDPADVRAVLGRGAWLPTMLRPVRVPALPAAPAPVARRAAAGTQLDLFASASPGGTR